MPMSFSFLYFYHNHEDYNNKKKNKTTTTTAATTTLGIQNDQPQLCPKVPCKIHLFSEDNQKKTPNNVNFPPYLFFFKIT